MDKWEIQGFNLSIGGFLAMIILTVIFVLIPDKEPLFDFYLIFMCVAFFLFIAGLFGIMEQKKEDDNQLIANQNAFQKEYDDYIKKIGVVRSKTHATLIDINERGFHSYILQYIWIENHALNMFPMSNYYKEFETTAVQKPDLSKLKWRTIPIESILYFEEMGELRKYTTVSGGGSSLKGALLGYMAASDAGAIIGSREPVKTEVISEDDRKIELIYKNSEDEIENLEFTHDAYEALKELIPTKDMRRIIRLNMLDGDNKAVRNESREDENTKKENRKNEVSSADNIKAKLRQLNEMKEEGLISDEEFAKQKERILNSF